MKYPKLEKAYDHRGSFMGRCDTIEEPEQAIKFRLYKLPMSDCGCYDNGGAYWGRGSTEIGFMYHAFGDGIEYKNEMFIRAKNREEAKNAIIARFPKAKFYR